MSQVYIVVATRDSEIETCETFTSVQSALGRGFQLAADKAGKGRIDLVNASPDEEIMLDGSTRWVFMNTNMQSVVVFYRKVEEALLSAKDPSNIVVGPLPTSAPPATDPSVQVSLPLQTPYDFMDRSLPVGWHFSEKPAFMQDLLDHPFDVKDQQWDLTDDQKWALAEVRVRKSPGYRSMVVDHLGFRPDQRTALLEIKGRTALGEEIRDAEIAALRALREDLISGINNA